MHAPQLLVLAKHAAPEVDPRRPPSEWTLGIEGINGSERLAERLRPLNLDHVIASVEPKAAETARIVAAALDLPWQSGHDLHEHARRSTGYLDRPLFEASIKRMMSEPHEVVFGDESANTAADRFEGGLRAIVRLFPRQRIAVVCHGTVMSLYLSRHYGLDAFATWKMLDVTGYVVLDPQHSTVTEVVPKA